LVDHWCERRRETVAFIEKLARAVQYAHGHSAKSFNRPGLQNALQALRSGKAKGLLIAKLDRLTRSVSDWQTLIDDYFGEKAGKSLFSVADSIDTRSSAGRLVLNVLLSVAQWEREAIGERTRDALNAGHLMPTCILLRFAPSIHGNDDKSPERR
jgi:DNA invertase Pin-like site-specific DNA recombinase